MRKTKSHTKIVVICCNILRGELQNERRHENTPKSRFSLWRTSNRKWLSTFVNSWKFARTEKRFGLCCRIGWLNWSTRVLRAFSAPQVATSRRERKSGQILFSLKGCGSSSFLSFAIINRSRRRNSTSSSLQSHAAEESLKVRSYLFIPKRSIAEKREFAVHVLQMEWNRNFERILLF